MKLNFGIVGMLLLCVTACKKVVEVRPTLPDEVVACALEPYLEGTWRSDSVHIATTVDSLDTTWVERFPTLRYQLRLACGDDSLAQLFYDNFAGVRTYDVQSTHYEANAQGLHVYSQLDSSTDTAEATYVLRFVSTGTETIHAWFKEILNSNQRTRTDIFFRKVQ